MWWNTTAVVSIHRAAVVSTALHSHSHTHPAHTCTPISRASLFAFSCRRAASAIPAFWPTSACLPGGRQRCAETAVQCLHKSRSDLSRAAAAARPSSLAISAKRNPKSPLHGALVAALTPERPSRVHRRRRREWKTRKTPGKLERVIVNRNRGHSKSEKGHNNVENPDCSSTKAGGGSRCDGGRTGRALCSVRYVFAPARERCGSTA